NVGVFRPLAVCIVALASSGSAAAETVHGLVYDDTNHDGQPSLGEPGVGNAVVALGVQQFVVTDPQGHFTLDVAPGGQALAWVRVPDGFVPGPVWTHVDGNRPDIEIDLPLRRLAAPHRGPITFVVAADTHLAPIQPFAADLVQ